MPDGKIHIDVNQLFDMIIENRKACNRPLKGIEMEAENVILRALRDVRSGGNLSDVDMAEERLLKSKLIHEKLEAMTPEDIQAVANKVIERLNESFRKEIISLESSPCNQPDYPFIGLLRLFSKFDNVEFRVLKFLGHHKDTKPGWFQQMLDKKDARKSEKVLKELEAYSIVYSLPFRYYKLVWLPEQHISSLIVALESIERNPLTINRLTVCIMPSGTPTCCNDLRCHSLCEARQEFLKGLSPLKEDFS